jgi:hypothetical protein
MTTDLDRAWRCLVTRLNHREGRFPLWVFLLPSLGFLLTWIAYLWLEAQR